MPGAGDGIRVTTVSIPGRSNLGITEDPNFLAAPVGSEGAGR